MNSTNNETRYYAVFSQPLYLPLLRSKRHSGMSSISSDFFHKFSLIFNNVELQYPVYGSSTFSANKQYCTHRGLLLRLMLLITSLTFFTAMWERSFSSVQGVSLWGVPVISCMLCCVSNWSAASGHNQLQTPSWLLSTHDCRRQKQKQFNVIHFNSIWGSQGLHFKHWY